MNVAILIVLGMVIVNVQTYSRKLEGKVAVVTGGAKGIGHAIADNYLKNGAKTVIIVDKNQPRGLKTEKRFNCIYGANRAVFIYGDITTDLKRVSNIIFKKFGCVDILVNNAGILNEDDPELMMNTNALATTLWTQTFFECMRKDRGGSGGTIMNVASIEAYMRDPFFWFYTSTKYAVLGFTFSLGHKYNFLYSGVRIFAICPGATRTDLFRQPQYPRIGPEDIFDRIGKVTVSQSADDVGKAAALLYKTADTGMAYTVEGGAPPVVSPDSQNVTAEYLLSL